MLCNCKYVSLHPEKPIASCIACALSMDITSCTIMFVQFEIIFCIAETDNKPVLGVLKELMTQYPSVPASIFQG